MNIFKPSSLLRISVSLLLVVYLAGCTQTLNSANSKASLSDRPQLTGMWTNASMTGLTRPAGIDKLILSKEEADRIANGAPIAGIPRKQIEAEYNGEVILEEPEKGGADFGVRGYNAFWVDPGSQMALVKGEYRSSYIVEPANGQVPRIPQNNANSNRGNSRYVTGIGGNSDPEALPISERCLIGFGNTGGPGMLSVLYNNTYQFVQTDTHVMIFVEMVHDARIIPTFLSKREAQANHRPSYLKPWLGDSVGWYEGGALFVETINLHPLQAAASAIPITDGGRITERFERYSDNEIFYSFTVEDENLYTQPWTAELSFYQTENNWYEYACHEGNYSMEGILAGARLEEQEANQ